MTDSETLTSPQYDGEAEALNLQREANRIARHGNKVSWFSFVFAALGVFAGIILGVRSCNQEQALGLQQDRLIEHQAKLDTQQSGLAAQHKEIVALKSSRVESRWLSSAFYLDVTYPHGETSRIEPWIHVVRRNQSKGEDWSLSRVADAINAHLKPDEDGQSPPQPVFPPDVLHVILGIKRNIEYLDTFDVKPEVLCSFHHLGFRSPKATLLQLGSEVELANATFQADDGLANYVVWTMDDKKTRVGFEACIGQQWSVNSATLAVIELAARLGQPPSEQFNAEMDKGENKEGWSVVAPTNDRMPEVRWCWELGQAMGQADVIWIAQAPSGGR